MTPSPTAHSQAASAARFWPSLRGRARNRIGLAFFLLALLLFGITGVLSGDLARRQAEDDAGAALQALAERLAMQLDGDMAARFHQIEQLAAMHDLLAVSASDAHWRDLLERLQRTTPYSWIGLAAPDGRVRAATGGLLEGQSVARRPWFMQGRERPLVGDVHEAQLLAKLLPPGDDGEPQRFVDVAAPLRGTSGELLGVLGAHLGWQWAEQRRQEVLALVKDRPGVGIVLVDPSGGLLLGPVSPLAAGLQQSGVRAQRWSDGVSQLSASSPSRARGRYPGMGWTVVVHQPQALALAAADAVQRRVWLLGLLGAALFGLLGWWLAGWLTAPLRRLAQQALQQSPTGQAAPPADDEVEQLALTLGTLLQELRTANETLEARVADRTASLQQANDDLREFSRSISHDLRGPLSSMAMVLRQRLQRDDGLEPRLRQTLELVAGEADRLCKLTGELLTLAMVEQRELQAQPVDHRALVAEVLKGLHPAPDVQVQCDPLPTLPGDALMLQQVWTNLLSNALKFSSRASPPRLQIRVHEHLPDHDGLVFEVADNGAGFDPSQTRRLFGVFQRLHADTDYPGTGVGLSIVRRVVHRHGGRVWAESTPGAGARFFFSLPRGADQAGSVKPC